MQFWRHALWLTAVVLAGCSAERPPLLFETEHFRYHAYESVCEEHGDWLEHHYATITEYLGTQLRPGDKIDVFVYEDTEALAEHACGQGAALAGCSDGQNVYTTFTYHPHELVHVYAGTLGTAPLFFQEGIAEVLGCRAPWGATRDRENQ